MNEPEVFEKELASLKPAQLPQDFAADLSRKLARLQPEAGSLLRVGVPTGSFFSGWLRWAIPLAAAIILIAALPLYRAANSRAKSRQNPVVAEKTTSTPTVSVLKPDSIVINQQLVGNFDAVTRLPDGVPVRIQCQEWMDEVKLRDPTRGVWVEQRKPRLEIVRASYEIY
jgi:hypothetical protein